MIYYYGIYEYHKEEQIVIFPTTKDIFRWHAVDTFGMITITDDLLKKLTTGYNDAFYTLEYNKFLKLL